MELREAFRAILASARVRDSWYRRDRVEAFLAAIDAMPEPAEPPRLPEIPPRCVNHADSAHARRLALNEAIAHIRGVAS